MKNALFLLLALPLGSLGATHRFEVVVYGGTAGGVMAAVSAAREVSEWPAGRRRYDSDAVIRIPA